MQAADGGDPVEALGQPARDEQRVRPGEPGRDRRGSASSGRRASARRHPGARRHAPAGRSRRAPRRDPPRGGTASRPALARSGTPSNARPLSLRPGRLSLARSAPPCWATRCASISTACQWRCSQMKTRSSNGREERGLSALLRDIRREDRELELSPVVHLGEAEVLDCDLVRVAHHEGGRGSVRVVHRRVHHPVQEVPVPGAPALLPAVVRGAGPARGEDEVDLVRRELAEVPGLDVLEMDGQPGVRLLHAVGERREETAETADGLVGHPVVHVHQGEAQGVHGQESGVCHWV